jgi:hypothetical protein
LGLPLVSIGQRQTGTNTPHHDSIASLFNPCLHAAADKSL